MGKRLRKPNPMSICVFSASSDAVDPQFFSAAKELGSIIARHGHTLVYGGGNVGLMGEIARVASANGGKVVGVIPKAIKKMVPKLKSLHTLIVTDDLRERKAIMERAADAFVGLPGGFGTLDEILEIIALKQLQYHSKPIVLVNTNGFYDQLARFFEQIYREKFAKLKHRDLYHITPDVQGIFPYIESFK